MSSELLIAQELRELLGDDPLPGCEVRWISTDQPTPAGDFQAVVPLLSRPFADVQFEGLPALKIVANCAVGVDNIDLAAAASRGIVVTNTPDVLTDSTADLTFALILAVSRRLKEGLGLVAEGRWEGWHPTQLLGLELKGRTLGLLGAGRIGRAVGKRARAFGMRLIYHSRSPKTEFEADLGAVQVDFSRLFRESDIVSVHVPLTEETRGMVGAIPLAECKPGQLLINTARGEAVDEEAVLEALGDGRLGGAGFDVYPDEPVVNPRLVAHPRVVTLPHIGSATWTTRRAMAALALANAKAVLSGEEPLTPVVDASQEGS